MIITQITVFSRNIYPMPGWVGECVWGFNFEHCQHCQSTVPPLIKKKSKPKLSLLWRKKQWVLGFRIFWPRYFFSRTQSCDFEKPARVPSLRHCPKRSQRRFELTSLKRKFISLVKKVVGKTLYFGPWKRRMLCLLSLLLTACPRSSVHFNWMATLLRSTSVNTVDGNIYFKSHVSKGKHLITVTDNNQCVNFRHFMFPTFWYELIQTPGYYYYMCVTYSN